MKFKTVIFPLMMVTTLVACNKNTVKYVDRETYHQQAVANEQKENKYRKATIKFKRVEKRLNHPKEVDKGTYHYTYIQEDEYWEPIEEKGDDYVSYFYEL